MPEPVVGLGLKSDTREASKSRAPPLCLLRQMSGKKGLSPTPNVCFFLDLSDALYRNEDQSHKRVVESWSVGTGQNLGLGSWFK